jgi:hypothetical protein
MSERIGYDGGWRRPAEVIAVVAATVLVLAGCDDTGPKPKSEHHTTIEVSPLLPPPCADPGALPPCKH